ncbi:MarC family protein [Methanocaldococcus indicus]|uniref:MarC family protein n=1 Tax=Methanocaldococcus indicus TaxID=213231 RepID=UPI003C6D7004
MDIQFFIWAFSSIISILNPIGAVPIFISLTESYPEKERFLIAKKVFIYATSILLVFALFGNYILSFFGISLDAFKIAGGILILLIALDMVRGKQEAKIQKKEIIEAYEIEEVALMPLATPLLAGPGSITACMVAMSEAHNYLDKILVIFAILLCMIITYVILIFSEKIMDKIGKLGIRILTRMMGFLLTAIAIQMIVSGLRAIFF